MIKLARKLPTKTESLFPSDNRHQVDVAAARTIVAERQRTGRIDPHRAITEDVQHPRRHGVKVARDFLRDAHHTSPTQTASVATNLRQG
jgi:hypothetical protein